jgi:glutamate-ammonia-ligase adenylyltransferase
MLEPVDDDPTLTGRPLSEAGAAAIEAFRAAGGDLGDPTRRTLVAHLGTHAPSLLPLALGDLRLIEDVLRRPLDLSSSRADLAESLRAWLGPAPEDDAATMAAIRRFRHRALTRIALRESLRFADIHESAAEMSDLAAVAIDGALEAARRTLERRFGRALDAHGAPIPIAILGMGKLGGRELNLGSDIDLIAFYGTDEGEVTGGDLTVHELFTRVVRRVARLLGDVTEDGFGFRVDLRLRPEGSRGPLVNSAAAAERYYETWGRTWERAALLRAAPVAGDAAFGAALLGRLKPFVFRRVVDPTLADVLAEMVERSRKELSAAPERDVKLGEGGIREVEFFVQSLQLIWGGQHPRLQVAGTLEALGRLHAEGLVSDRERARLSAAWAFLRRVEHRLHVFRGHQTHLLPDARTDAFAKLAQSLGHAEPKTFARDLAMHRARVHALFAGLRVGADAAPSSPWEPLLERVAGQAGGPEVVEALGRHPAFAALDADERQECADHLRRLARRVDGPLGAVTRDRNPGWARLLLEATAETVDPALALLHLADFFGRIGRSEPYQKLFADSPRLLRRAMQLFASSRTLSRALVGHPEELDLLLTGEGAPDEAGLRGPYEDLNVPDGDIEGAVRELRRLQRIQTLQIGLALTSGELELFEACQRLTVVAEEQVRAALRHATADVEARWARRGDPTPRGRALAVVGLGKLGAEELGFGSDLDLMFLHGPVGDAPGRVDDLYFARVAQKTMFLLRQSDVEGPGYETDTRLRPSGSQGTLVVSLAAFDAYHAKGAAEWERQALLRGRVVAGPAAVAEAIEARLGELAYGRGRPDPATMAALRGRIQRETAREERDRVHPKVGYGGLVDVEFATQLLQMRHGVAHPAVRTPTTRRGLRALRRLGLIDPHVADALLDAHRFLRAVEQIVQLHDARGDRRVPLSGPVGGRIAAALGLSARDGQSPQQVFAATYRRHAEAVRRAFERLVGPVDAGPPWEDVA